MRTARLSIAILLFSMLLAACSSNGEGGDLMPGYFYEVDTQFKEFYTSLGGDAILGPALSPLFNYGHVRYQYTLAALMVYDSLAPESQQYQLAALPKEAGISEPPVPPPGDKNQRYVNGHVIHPAFEDLYLRLSGARFAGKPLTEIHYNAERKRYEQHFENVGMFWYEFEGSEEPHLLSYGAWMCGRACPTMEGAAPVDIPPRVHENFVAALTRLGPDLVGFPLADAYTTPDGYLEQVFENVVLVYTPDQPGQVSLRPLPELIGIRPDPLTKENGDPWLYFYPIDEDRDLGYNVSTDFYDYMAEHGGQEIAGAPITEFKMTGDQGYEQCFQHYCLRLSFENAAPVVKPVSHGLLYLQGPRRPYNEPRTEGAEVPAAPFSESTLDASAIQPQQPVSEQSIPQDASPDRLPGEVVVQVWESHPVIPPNQEQQIGVLVYEDNQPVPNIEPDLTVNLPDGKNKVYYMYPTDARGITEMNVDPLDLPSGTVVPYQVCMYQLFGVKFCVLNDYLIWQGP